jgi:3-methylfumaryl-CoA hydratase
MCRGTTPVDLFRFSAVTFNSHRIHYDLPYATAEEAIPAWWCTAPSPPAACMATPRPARRPARPFAFRAVAPLFCGQPIVLRQAGGMLSALAATAPRR